MSAPIECPICFDPIASNQVSNIVTTECGHTFHCNCLMKNCAHNGFGCPLCRTIMATPPEEEEEEDNDSFSGPNDEEIADYALRGLRFFFNNLNGEPHDEEDVLEEQEDEEEGHEENYPKPSATYVTERLAASGITMEQLVKVLLLDHDEYDEEEEEFDRISEDIWGRMRTIISNYIPQEQAPVQEQSLPQSAAIELLSQEAEPKTQIRTRRPEMITHV